VISTNGGIAMNRQLLAEKIMALKHAKRISWKELAEAIGRSHGRQLSEMRQDYSADAQALRDRADLLRRKDPC
jgi:hypothetical protein